MYFYVWFVRVYVAHTVSSIVISGVPGVFSERATFFFVFLLLLWFLDHTRLCPGIIPGGAQGTL